MANFQSFKGAVTELITPFTANGDVDYDLLRGEVEYQIKSGIAGLFTNGLASEALSLSIEELIETTRVVVEATAGRVPVMANIVGNTTRDALTVLKGYEAAGVDAISMSQPCVYGFTQPALAEYFTTVFQATKLPCCIYNAPQSGNTLAPATVAKIFQDVENCFYYKESVLDFVHIQETIRLIGHDRPMEFLNGSDATTFPIMQLGGLGIISLISAVFPEPIIKLCDLHFAGKIEEAQAQQEYVLQLRQALKCGPFVAGYKYASELIGVPLGYMRKPLADLNDAEKAKIKENLIKLGLIEA